MTSTKYDEWRERSEAAFGPVVAQQRNSQPHADADGTASFYYFDPDRSLAFHWTGNPDHKVEVSFGGDHEEALFFFEANRVRQSDNCKIKMMRLDGQYRTNVHLLVLGFKSICQAWVEIVESNA